MERGKDKKIYIYKRIKRGWGANGRRGGRGGNWTSVIILILQLLNMHKWDLIHRAENAWSHSGNNYKCVLMHVPYYVRNVRAIHPATETESNRNHGVSAAADEYG